MQVPIMVGQPVVKRIAGQVMKMEIPVIDLFQEKKQRNDEKTSQDNLFEEEPFADNTISRQ